MNVLARRSLIGVAATMALVTTAWLTSPASSREPSAEKTSLWKVSGGRGTVYLLGSVHLLKEDDYPLDSRIDRAFEEADIVVFEVDPDSLETPELQTYILKNAFYDGERTLRSELGDSVYAVASARAESLGIDLASMDAFRPWFVSITLAFAELERMGFDAALGVDMHYAGKAKESGKSIVGLETARYQMGLFVTLTPEQQRDLLMHTLAQLSDIENELGKLLTAWKKGDLAIIEDTLNRSLKDYPDIYEKLMAQRNRDWVSKVDGFLRDGKTHIVIVGVGHMPGSEGLIALLEEKGFEIEQM